MQMTEIDTAQTDSPTAAAEDPSVGYRYSGEGRRSIYLRRTKNGVVVVAAMLLAINHLFHYAAKVSYDEEQFQRKASSLVVSKQDVNRLCNKTNDVVKSHALLFNGTEALLGTQTGPFHVLTCEQLIRSLPILRNSSNDISGRYTTVSNGGITSSTGIGDGSDFELQNLISLQRLAAKLSKLERRSDYLTVVVIGGSMTEGRVDGKKRKPANRDIAFPRKLEQFMRHQWPASRLKVINIAEGGANENFWIDRLGRVMKLDPDVILVESAVNDQCDFDKQDEKAKFVNSTSFSLLNLLMNLPQQPAVISVELFRAAWGSVLDANKDANNHCPGHVQTTSDPQCFFCPQWWKPQTWRENAREYNSVSQASYRDAVWPILDHPPDELCSKYWTGLSHPQTGVHAMVASTIFFQFLVVMEKRNELLQLSNHSNGAKAIDIPKDICLDHISSYRAIQGDPKDPFIGDEENNLDSCWEFRADVQWKYGWICEVDGSSSLMPRNAFRLSKKLRIGGDRKVIISRLVSYDERMATAQVWFTSSRLDHSCPDNSTVNIFKGDPVWNISSWHEDKTSIPQSYAIQMDELQFKDCLQIQWQLAEAGDDTNSGGNAFDNRSGNGNVHSKSSSAIEVTFNLKILLGTSISQVHKFKLLGIETC
jgi:hypothetical protein